jgi:hypothetical protein
LQEKLLNIFLRDALCTTHLVNEFGLNRAETNFEIPLDSITARHLRQEAGRGKLPRWPGVKHLEKEPSTAYQEFARTFAASETIARVHLDTYWWGTRGSHRVGGPRNRSVLGAHGGLCVPDGRRAEVPCGLSNFT